MTAPDPMADRPSALPGVRYGAVARHVDGRGSFRELWRATDFPDAGFGRAFVALVDVRPLLGGSGGAAIETRELPADSWVYIPTGVAHGFLAVEPLQLVYLVTNAYDGTDELGFAWDDPAVGVAWPVLEGTPGGRPVTSDRDAANPPLAELVVRLRSSPL
jgi:dTDP-4-dehydrorhamnose 3,5-epimerase-like enzyme